MIDIKKIFLGNRRHLETTGEDFYTPHLSGQSPALCIIYCSDSRENIHLISDLEPKMGEVFTIENAGNIIDGSSSAIGSITYCLAHLNTKELLILGHTSCGAINTVFSDYKKDHKLISAHIRYLENIKKITLHVIRAMEERQVTEQDILENERYLAIASEINVAYQCEYAAHLIKTLTANDIKIFGAIHDMSGIYGGKKGTLILTSEQEPTEMPESHKSRLADYGKNKTIRDVLEELNIVFYSTLD